MKAAESDVHAALARIEDPELHRPITELGMVDSVRVKKRHATVVVRLPADPYPLAGRLQADIEAAAGDVDAIEAVAVDFIPMSDGQIEALQDKLGRTEAASGPQGNIRQNLFQTGEAHARVIAVASGKGGVGKSTITTNLAAALTQVDGTPRVGALDADIYGFSIPRMIGVDRPPTIIGDMVVPPEANGVGTISMGFFVDEDRPIMWRGPMIHKAMEQFLVDVYWGGMDYVLIDMPPGTGEIAISMSQFLPDVELIVVTTPQPTAQRVAQRAGKMAERMNQHILGVVENMSWLELPDGSRRHIFGEGGGQALADDLDVPLLGQVPLDEELRESADVGKPIVISSPDNPSARAIRSIAERIHATPRKKIRRPELKIKSV